MKGTLINDYVVYDYAETMALEPYVHDVIEGRLYAGASRASYIWR
jgi:hypothetical protein